MALRRDFLTNFCACDGFLLRALCFLLCVLVCDAFQDENTLTIDVAVETGVPNTEQWSTYSPDDVRCYCNLPMCVATGYMCKSEGGGCFSEVVDRDSEQMFRSAVSSSQDVYKGRHGCLELLENEDQKTECKNMPGGKGSYRSHPRSLLLCCFKDMCNHIDSPETQTMLNGTLIGTLSDNPSHPSMMSPHEPNISTSPGYNSNEVWFKAAIIAVPICGIVILFLLIFLAVKILRTDTLSSSSKLGGPYLHGHDRNSNRDHFDQVHPHSGVNLKKIPLLIHHQHHDVVATGACTNHSADELLKHTAVPLLVQNETGAPHSDKKNEANARLNTAHGHEYNLVQNKDRESNSPLLGLHKPINTSSNNVYRNVNLSLTPAPTAALQSQSDKLYDKQALSAVISWGVPSPSSSPV